MTAETPNQFSATDIASAADKLATFAATLREGEQAVLGRAIMLAAQAGPAEGEVQGYTMIEILPMIALLEVIIGHNTLTHRWR